MDVAMSHERPAERAGFKPLVVPVQPVVSTSGATVEAAYRAHYRHVYRYVLSLTRSADDAKDITAEVFERAIGAWSEPPDPALPWLLLTARRIATDRWRRARRQASLLLGVSQRVPSAGEAETDFWAWFDAVAKILTERQREALTVRYQEDLSDAGIATVMGLSESGVRSLVARAIEALRSHPEVL
jgi:RNA polymerase sigma-70 factor (ECF subfamily)